MLTETNICSVYDFRRGNMVVGELLVRLSNHTQYCVGAHARAHSCFVLFSAYCADVFQISCVTFLTPANWTLI